MLKAIIKLFAPKWRVRKATWPYPEGYCTYKKVGGQITVLDTGLTKEQAKEICKELNQ